MNATCHACGEKVALGDAACVKCGQAEPDQAWLHLAAGVRFLRAERFYRASWEFEQARLLDGKLPRLDDYVAQASAGSWHEQVPARFVTPENLVVEELPWGPHDWLCRPDLVEAEDLLLVRVHIPPGKAHEFHRHPEMEELIYVLEGTAEQWVDRQMRRLGPGDTAHIPRDVVHGTYNIGDTTLRVLAILSPAKIAGPPLVDVSQDEPWKSLRQ